MNRYRLFAPGLLIVPVLALAACGGGGDDSTVPPTTTPPVSTAKMTDVSPCLNQLVAGRKVSSLVIPDVITLDTTVASGFPNGRRLEDPVVDLTLGVLFLDLTKTGADTLAKLPLDPPGNDKSLTGQFPYLADAHGGTPAATGGSGFVFRTEDAGAYTRVDRMGEPAVATALISSANKTAYNDDSPIDDAAGKWVSEIVKDLTALTDALRDDFTAAKLPLCATQS